MSQNVYKRYSTFFKRSQEVILLGIVYNAFCIAITSKLSISLYEGMGLLLFLPILHGISLMGTFQIFTWLFQQPMFRNKELIQLPEQQHQQRATIVSSVLCTSQKTLAFGLPIIQTIFRGNVNLAYYCTPIMLLHPIQLLMGTILVPKFQQYIVSPGQNNGTTV